MQISLILIAHNEESSISHAIRAIFSQSLLPAEIIVVAHNCTDNTAQIASSFERVTVIDYPGPTGPEYARAKGFERASGDILVSLDADSYPANRYWLEELTRPLHSASITGAGGPVIFTGSIYGFFMSLNFFFFKSLIDPKHWVYFWGANFAIRKSDYEKIGGLTPLIQNHKKWQLAFSAEDYYLAKRLSALGRIAFVSKAMVLSRAKSMPFGEWLARSRKQETDKDKIDAGIARL